ncbi:unnamed protein product [Symbiodinium sp. CCMP2592]|nr:unnamed protein product [Symbiodinium sp. CCMP2592]
MLIEQWLGSPSRCFGRDGGQRPLSGSCQLGYRGQCLLQEHRDTLAVCNVALGLPISFNERFNIWPTTMLLTAGHPWPFRSTSWQQALGVMAEMVRTRMQPNVVVYGAAITACASGQWERSLQMLLDMQGTKVLPNVVSCSAVISACVRGAQWVSALEILQQMSNAVLLPDLITFSASMSACAGAGQWQRAIQLLAEMKRVQVQPNIFSYNAAVDAFTQTSEGWAGVLQLLSDMHQEQVQLQTETYSSAMRACGLAGCWATALLLWEQLWHSPLVVDAVAMGAIISACRWDVSLSLLRHMVTSELRPDAVNFAQSIVACENAGRFRVGTSLLAQLAAEAKSVAQFTWQNAPRYETRWLREVRLARQNRSEVVLKLLEGMRQEGPFPDAVCCNSVLKACSEGRDAWKLQSRLVGEMKRAGPEPDIATYGALLASLGRAGRWEACMDVLAELKTSSLESNVIVYSTAVSACNKASQWQSGLRVLEDMHNSIVPPNLFTFSAAISACAKGQEWEGAMALLHETRDRGLTPDLMVLSAAILACGEGSQWENSISLLREACAAWLLADW